MFLKQPKPNTILTPVSGETGWFGLVKDLNALSDLVNY